MTNSKLSTDDIGNGEDKSNIDNGSNLGSGQGAAIFRELIDNPGAVAKAVGVILPVFNQPRLDKARYMFWIGIAAITAMWSLIIAALCTHNDAVVRGLVIALASFLGGFATSKGTGGE